MNMGKDLTEVRSPQRQLAPDIVGLEQGEPTFLRGIATKAKTKKRHRFRDLYRCLNEELIYHAWGSLNKGAASGVDRVSRIPDKGTTTIVCLCRQFCYRRHLTGRFGT